MRLWRTDEIRALSAGDALLAAAAIGRTPRAVQVKARREGIPAPRMPHASYWSPATRRRARTLRSHGLPVSKISEALGVPFGTVRRWVYEQQEQAA